MSKILQVFLAFQGFPRIQSGLLAFCSSCNQQSLIFTLDFLWAVNKQLDNFHDAVVPIILKSSLNKLIAQPICQWNFRLCTVFKLQVRTRHQSERDLDYGVNILCINLETNAIFWSRIFRAIFGRNSLWFEFFLVDRTAILSTLQVVPFLYFVLISDIVLNWQVRLLFCLGARAAFLWFSLLYSRFFTSGQPEPRVSLSSKGA